LSWRAIVLPVSGSNDARLVDVVAEQLDAQPLLFVRRIDLDDVAADAEGAAAEVGSLRSY
jgi:hypothetical protein